MGNHLGIPGAADMGSFINACLEGSEKCQIHPHWWKGSMLWWCPPQIEYLKAIQIGGKITYGAETTLKSQGCNK